MATRKEEILESKGWSYCRDETGRPIWYFKCDHCGFSRVEYDIDGAIQFQEEMDGTAWPEERK